MQNAEQPTVTLDPAGRCPVCGCQLAPHVPLSRCPRCLLWQGLRANPSGDQVDSTASTVGSFTIPALPEPGESFGHYEISRLLGHGGMGAVFEAEDLDSGRRVALKVLGHQLDSPEARSRFLREGRLAASVNHPNSVYVFGTEDIAGIPVIAMELVAGGTLQDRISSHGPMLAPEAVDGVLQIIAGLEAAQRMGVLHRDIKPSNCFVEANGTVKIGDFGLSISTLVRAEPAITATGTFLGTPAFSSPEQLRGDELTVRSDIYSVGVTLYYLLTGHHPFEASDMVRLLATVLERRAESPAKWQPGLSNGLCQVVLRCLEKDPKRRFRNYPELRNALLPYASAAPTPATLSLRFLAGFLDSLVLILPLLIIDMFLRGPGQPAQLTINKLLLINSCRVVLLLIYYGLLEGLWGASVGKFICGLRVAQLDRTVPGVPRALLRAFVFNAVPVTVWLLGNLIGQAWLSGVSRDRWNTAFSVLTSSIWILMFVTARARNGFAGLHDLASGSRVITKAAYQPRPVLSLANESLPNAATLPEIGPYHVLVQLDSKDTAELLLGFDPRLLRQVWIRKLPTNVAPIALHFRQLGRSGRIRWLAGRRTVTEAWDAYEAVPGQPLSALIQEPQEWSDIRFWLLDLAEELDAATQDGTLPATLKLDHIWITADGRAKLIDFPVPGTVSPQPGAPQPAEFCAPTPHAFLRQVALSALEGRAVQPCGTEVSTVKIPLALHAGRFLEALQTGANLKESIAELRSLLSLPAQVSRVRRAALLAGAMTVPVLIGLVGGFIEKGSLQELAERAALRWYLTQYQEMETRIKSSDPDFRTDIEALETYIAGRFAPLVTNAVRWENIGKGKSLADSLRAHAEPIIIQRHTPSLEEFAEASIRMKRIFPKPTGVAAREPLGYKALPFAASVIGYTIAAGFVVLPCLICSLLFRGGALVKLLGIVFVHRTGRVASRWRVTARNIVAWVPFLLQPIGVVLLASQLGTLGALLLISGLCAALALSSILLPKRGLADRVAGTWLVPR
ncbi:MAG TPA: protein kinase [Candidatus Paceibacterota bacterium]|nr:protein kinase [Candidatus Paceibacterota bacterium]